MIRVFPVRTQWTPDDDMAFVGFPPMFQAFPSDTPVRVSVAFTWERLWAEKIAAEWRRYYGDVQVGGPAYMSFAGGFVAGRFLKTGCTITSRGCPKKCGWCNVPTVEGPLRELEQFPDGYIVQDNNLLACSREHFDRVFEMLRNQKRRIFFNGGLDKHFLQPWHRDYFDSIPLGELWFACDRAADIPALEKILPILDGIPLRKRRCYTMLGYEGETLDQAKRRVERVLEIGFMPFTQLYQPPHAGAPTVIYSADWKALNKKWCRPARYMGRKTDSQQQSELWGAEERNG